MALATVALINPFRYWLKDKSKPTNIIASGMIVLLLLFMVLYLFPGFVHTKIDTIIERTHLKYWDWIALGVAMASFVISARTLHSQSMTEKNTMRITPESQKALLMDYARHFYCNLLIIYAIDARLNRRYHHYYPSEEHLLKLRTNVDSLHPAAFFNTPTKYDNIHELKFKMLNFNLELEVITKHLTDRNVHPFVKDRDFATLKFKMGFLTQEVAKTIRVLFWDSYYKMTKYTLPKDNDKTFDEIKNKIDNEIDRIVADELVEYIFDKTKNRNKNNTKMIDALKYFKDHDYYLTYNDAIKGSLIKTLFPDGNKDEIDRFLQRLNQNIYVEVYGTNDQNSPKICLIPFHTPKTPRYLRQPS